MNKRPRLLANFSFNVIGMGLPVLISLIAVPIYLSHIGVARYGVLSIVWILLGYFGFLDFGLSRASANALSKSPHQSAERSRILMTSLYLNLLQGIAGGILLYFIGGPFLRHVLDLSDGLAMEVERSVPWIAAMLPLALVGGVGIGAIESRERFFTVNLLVLIGVVLGQVLPLISAVMIGPSLAIVIPAAFVARAVSVGLILIYIARTERPALGGFDRRYFGELFGFGAWVTVTNIISPLLDSIDQLLIGSTLGPIAVAHYSVPMNLVGRSQTFAAALSRALFPRFSRLGSANAGELAEKSAITLAYALGAICSSAIIIGNPFLTWWVGSNFASRAIPVFELLMIGAWVNGVAFIPFALLQGQGRPDLVAKLHALEFLPFIFVLWILLQHFGLPGAALAWSTRVTVDAILLFKTANFQWRNLLRLVPILLVLMVSYSLTQAIDMSPLYSVIVAGAIFLICVGFGLVFDAMSRRLLLDLGRRLFPDLH
jgi:O-antigen/teichoic acid export membrane protein